MTVLNEGMHEGEFIGELAMGIGFHVDAVTVASGQNLKGGAVVGSVPSGTSASATKSGGNTGTGTFVLDATTPILPRAKEGVYTLRCITAATNSGTFRLEDPEGFVLGDFTITGGAGGTVTVAEQIKGVITDAGTDFVVGDGFDITISALTEKLVEYNPTGADGSQIVRGILMKNTNATSGDTASTALRRGSAIVNANDLVWKTGISAAQKATATAALLRLSIKAV